MNAVSQRAASQASTSGQSRDEAAAPTGPAQPNDTSRYEQKLAKMLKTEAIKGQAVGGAALGAASISLGFDCVCTQKASYPSEQALACVLSAPSVKVGGRSLLALPSLISAPLGYVAPASLYVTHFPDKVADWTSAALAWGFEGIPWDNVKALVQRLPGSDYPQACDPTEPAAGCADPLSWERAARVAPYCQGALCVVLGVVVGASLGKAVWRDGVRHIAGLPTLDAMQLPLDAFASAIPGAAALKKTVVPPYNFAVKMARAEVARREAWLQEPHEPHEQTPLLPRPA